MKTLYILLLLSFTCYSQKWSDSIIPSVVFEFDYGKSYYDNSISLNKNEHYGLSARFKPEKRIHSKVSVNYSKAELSTDGWTTRDFDRYTIINRSRASFNKVLRVHKKYNNTIGLYINAGAGFRTTKISEPWNGGGVFLNEESGVFAVIGASLQVKLSRDIRIACRWSYVKGLEGVKDSVWYKKRYKSAVYDNPSTLKLLKSNLSNISFSVSIYPRTKNKGYISDKDKLREARILQRKVDRDLSEEKRYENLDLTQALIIKSGVIVNGIGAYAQIILRESNLNSEDEEEDENNPVNHLHKQPLYELNGIQYTDYSQVYNTIVVGSIVSIEIDRFGRGNNGTLIIKTR